jgi:hypothetical protein
MSTQNRQHWHPVWDRESYGSEAQKLSEQRSDSERSTQNDQSCLKPAISLTDAETYRGRLLKGDFSGRRLLFEGLLTSAQRAGE